MQIYILKDGARVEVARVMQGPPLTPGYWWSQEAPLGSGESIWREVVQPATARPNTLFGYDEAEFMAKQYRKKRAN
jgi:hypothetical protein